MKKNERIEKTECQNGGGEKNCFLIILSSLLFSNMSANKTLRLINSV
jgi:hypothetical protein